MKEFLRLQLKLKWGINRNNSKITAALMSVASILVVVTMLVLIYVLASMLINTLDIAAMQIAQLFLVIIEIALTVMAISMQVKRVYRPTDVHITSRFPISAFKIYISNLVLNYIDLAIYSFILIIPVMIVFGIAAKIISVTYILGIALGAFFAPLIPFAVSLLVSIPIAYVSLKLEHHNIISLIIFIVFLIGAFTLYNYVLTILADYFINSQMTEDTVDVWQSVLNVLGSPYNPLSYLANVIFFYDVWAGIGITIGTALVLGTVGIFISRPVYKSVNLKAREGDADYFRAQSKVDNYGPMLAQLRYGFKQIIRTKTYAYFYLGIAIATPVMVFFCNRLVIQVGQAQIGAIVNYGASLLVIAAFVAMISSFAGNVLTMEGKNFYLTKLIPVSYKNQLLIKGFLNFCVSVGALLISCIILASLKFISAGEMFILLGIQTVFAAGAVFNGLNLNLANPNLRIKVNGESDEINIIIMMLLGLVISALLGAGNIIAPFFMPSWAKHLITAGVVLIYAGINILIFFLTADKKYRSIEL